MANNDFMEMGNFTICFPFYPVTYCLCTSLCILKIHQFYGTLKKFLVSMEILFFHSESFLKVEGIGKIIQPSHPLSSPSPPDHNPSQHQSLFQ